MESNSNPIPCCGQPTPVFPNGPHQTLISSNTTVLLPALYPTIIKQTEINWVIGMTVGGVSSGILLTLGLICLGVLRRLPRPLGLWNQRNMLMLHVCLLMLSNVALEVKGVRGNMVAIFETRPEALTYFYLDWSNIVIVVVFALTDGLLVWRCYMVQRVLLGGRPARWQHICWVLPLILWFTMIGIGTISVIISNPNIPFSEPADPFAVTLLVISTFCNILLNFFATTNIIIRLLIHRRVMIASFGRSSSLSNFHLRIVGILLESAIINLPISIAAAVCAVLVGGFGVMAMQIGTPLQSCSSVLVILQVARGRAIGSESNSGSKGTESHRLDTVVFTQTSFHNN